MPLLKLSTNTVIAETQNPQLLSDLSHLLAQTTGKPERYVMVAIEYNSAMLFAGDSAPLAYLECKSIGLSQAQAKTLAKSLCQYLESTLGIAQDRVYIEFSNCPGEFWGWNGATFG